MEQITVNIDRLMLEGLDMTPAEAERFRASVASALEYELKGQGLATGKAGSKVSRLVAPTSAVSNFGTESGMLARNVAQSIARSLQLGD